MNKLANPMHSILDDTNKMSATKRILQKLLLLSLAVLLPSCASTPPTSDIVIIAAAHADNKTNNLKSSPWVCLKDNNVVDKKHFFAAILDKTFEKETGFNKEQRQEALDLLLNDKFTSDLRDLIVLILLSISPKTMSAVLPSIEGVASLPIGLYSCLTKRQCTNLADVIDVANKIYENPSIKLQRETLAALLDNRSFRLALIAYAHINGVDIRDEDLTFVQNQLKKDGLDMESLMNEGKQRLKEKYKIDDVEDRLACLER